MKFLWTYNIERVHVIVRSQLSLAIDVQLTIVIPVTLGEELDRPSETWHNQRRLGGSVDHLFCKRHIPCDSIQFRQ